MSEQLHYVTEIWLMANRTKRGGWTRDQLQVLGVAWPPQPGWIDRVHALHITQAQRQRFEQRLNASEAKRAPQP